MRIFLDMDGVVSNFVQGVLNDIDIRPELGDGCGKPPLKWTDWNEWDFYKQWMSTEDFEAAIRATPKFWENLPKHEWADDLAKAVSAFDPRWTFLTTPMESDDRCQAGKAQWMHDNMPDRFILFSSDKAEYCNGPEDILIDDKQENVDAWREAGGTGILFPAPWNEGCDFASDPVPYVADRLLSFQREHVKSITEGNTCSPEQPETPTEGNTCSPDDNYIMWEGRNCPDWMDADNPPEGLMYKGPRGLWKRRSPTHAPLIRYTVYRIPSSLAPDPEPETPTDHCKFDGAGWYRLVGGKCVELDDERHCSEGNGLIDCFGEDFEWLWETDGTIDSVIPANKEPVENWYLSAKLDGPPPELRGGLKHKHPPEYRLPRKGELIKDGTIALSGFNFSYNWIVEKVEAPEDTPGLQLEVGKSYRRADGSVDEIVYHQTPPTRKYPFKGSSGWWYMSNGQLGDIGLIEEVPPPQPTQLNNQVTRFTDLVSDMPDACEPFVDVLLNAMELHSKKAKDYGTSTDPYANVRASEDFGVPAWVGALIRANDKIVRVKTFLEKGTLEFETIDDSLDDLVVYFAIIRMLRDEVE